MTQSNNDEEYRLLIKEYDRYDVLHTQNLINQDNVLVQLSVGILAVISTFGQNILKADLTLGYVVVVALGLTILQVVCGYLLSNRFFVFVKARLNDNYANGRSLNDGTDGSLEGKINDFINVFQIVTFTAGMLFFSILLIIYMGKL